MMRITTSTICPVLVLGIFAILWEGAVSFAPFRGGCRNDIFFVSKSSSSSSPCTLWASSITPPLNEFSRLVDTNRILKTSSGKRTRSYREYQLDVEATPEECLALQDRFGLTCLKELKGAFTISSVGKSTASHGLLTVQVEGTISASVTQTCVRTNDPFDLDLELPLYAIVKPIASNTASMFPEEDPQQSQDHKRSKKVSTNNLNDMMELQEMLDRLEDEEEDALVEDEGIYSLKTGKLDVGELVAQNFWLGLDPYPKKPGSAPLRLEISG